MSCPSVCNLLSWYFRDALFLPPRHGHQETSDFFHLFPVQRLIPPQLMPLTQNGRRESTLSLLSKTHAYSGGQNLIYSFCA